MLEKLNFYCDVMNFYEKFIHNDEEMNKIDPQNKEAFEIIHRIRTDSCVGASAFAWFAKQNVGEFQYDIDKDFCRDLLISFLMQRYFKKRSL